MTPDEATEWAAEHWHDSEWMLRAMQAAVRKALLDHKQKGDPIVGYRDGELAWIPANEIVIGKPMKRKRSRPEKSLSAP